MGELLKINFDIYLVKSGYPILISCKGQSLFFQK